MVRVKRVYEDPAPDDGQRVLVDRLWPRGLRRDGANLDEWLRDVAPSTELRRWYGHDPQRFDEFARRYRTELRDRTHAEALRDLRDRAKSGHLTLLTATREVDISAARVLADVLDG
ncbi:MAG TPA: DUF488 family protein [Micromonosporaceae bacterium]